MLNAQYIHLSFFNAAGASLIAQGFAAPDNLEQLTSKEVVGLCKCLRSPGGLIPNPVAILGVDGALPPGVPLFVVIPEKLSVLYGQKEPKAGHYFGQSQENNELNEAKNTLTITYYIGEKRNFIFKTYAGIHRSAHNTFNDCCRNPMEERHKVRRLIDGIRCSNCKAAVNSIHEDNCLQNDFDLMC